MGAAGLNDAAEAACEEAEAAAAVAGAGAADRGSLRDEAAADRWLCVASILLLRNVVSDAYLWCAADATGIAAAAADACADREDEAEEEEGPWDARLRPAEDRLDEEAAAAGRAAGNDAAAARCDTGAA